LISFCLVWPKAYKRINIGVIPREKIWNPEPVTPSSRIHVCVTLLDLAQPLYYGTSKDIDLKPFLTLVNNPLMLNRSVRTTLSQIFVDAFENDTVPLIKNSSILSLDSAGFNFTPFIIVIQFIFVRNL